MAPRAPEEPQIDAPDPWSNEEVESSMLYKILMQFDTPKGIKVSVSSTLWPRTEGLPDVIKGEIMQWMRKESKLLKISWVEPDGSSNWDSDTLHVLLAHDFKVLLGPRGEALHLRGAARVEEEARQPKRTIDVPYKDGLMEKI